MRGQDRTRIGGDEGLVHGPDAFDALGIQDEKPAAISVRPSPSPLPASLPAKPSLVLL